MVGRVTVEEAMERDWQQAYFSRDEEALLSKIGPEREETTSDRVTLKSSIAPSLEQSRPQIPNPSQSHSLEDMVMLLMKTSITTNDNIGFLSQKLSQEIEEIKDSIQSLVQQGGLLSQEIGDMRVEFI